MGSNATVWPEDGWIAGDEKSLSRTGHRCLEDDAKQEQRCQRAPIPSPVQSLELIRSFLRHKDAVRQVRAKLFFCLAWVFGEELVENGVGITVTISGLQSRRKRPDDKPVDEAEARANLPSEFPWVLS